jgi:hypothetical protein
MKEPSLQSSCLRLASIQMKDTIEEQALRDPLLSVVESRASNTAEAITYSVLISITIPTQIKPGSF